NFPPSSQIPSCRAVNSFMISPGSTADAQHLGLAIDPLALDPADGARASEDLHGLLGAQLEALRRQVLGHVHIRRLGPRADPRARADRRSHTSEQARWGYVGTVAAA